MIISNDTLRAALEPQNYITGISTRDLALDLLETREHVVKLIEALAPFASIGTRIMADVADTTFLSMAHPSVAGGMRAGAFKTAAAALALVSADLDPRTSDQAKIGDRP